MNNKLFLLILKHIDKLIEQTKTKPQETLEFKLSKQRKTFSFSSPIKIVDEGKLVLAITYFEAKNSVSK